MNLPLKIISYTTGFGMEIVFILYYIFGGNIIYKWKFWNFTRSWKSENNFS